MKKTIHSKSEKDTKDAGYNLAKELKKGDIVLLYGDLGFGKTTFVKGVARGLTIKNRIISPTFTIIREHKNLYHIDLYRIESNEQIKALGFSEIIESAFVKLIEWPENIYGFMPKKRIDVKILLNKDNTRTINIARYE